MSAEIWSLIHALTKALYLAGAAMAVGGLTALALPVADVTMRNLWRRHAVLGGVIGLLTMALGFLLQVGALAEAGIGSMVHPLYVEILWSSAVGEASRYRGVGLILLLVAASLAVAPISGIRKWTVLAAAFSGASLLAASFATVGHTVGEGAAVRVAVALHALAALWWVGSLWPLWRACRKLDTPSLHRLLSGFGRFALLPMLMLLAGGIYLVFRLVAPLEGIGAGAWGRWLIGKLLLVSGMLALALYHRQWLVPRLVSSGRESIPLQTSIGIETGLAFLVLVATAILTTLVGPEHG